MRRAHRIAASAIVIGMLSLFAIAQSGSSSYGPAPHQSSSKSRDSLLDFTLKRINPSDKDAGQCLSEARTLLVQETIRNAYFWSNIIALGILGCLFTIVVYQQRIQANREWTTAEIITEYEQSLARSRAQITEATRKNHELMEALARRGETASQPVSLPVESSKPAASSVATSRRTSDQSVQPATARANFEKPTNGGSPRASATRESTNQMRLFTSDADFVMKLNSLEQQLAQSREDNRQLRRRIADGDRRAGAKLSAQGSLNSAEEGVRR